jgi:PAS domain S-box-containing protein
MNILETSNLRNVILFTPLLAAAGFAANYFNLPLFFSVSFIFGSVAALIALLTLGLIPALFVSVVASSYTWILWGHPYAMLIFFAEILFVGLLRKRIPIIAYSDLLFWILIGAPAVLIIYPNILELELTSSILIALKQPINGIFNAILASLFVYLFSLLFLRKKQGLSVRDLVASSVMLMAIVAGGIPIIQNNFTVQQMQEDNLVQAMNNYGYSVAEELNTVRSLNQENEEEAMKVAEDFVKQRLKIANLGIIVTFTEPVKRVTIGWSKLTSYVGEIVDRKNGLQVWQPSGNMPAMKKWKQSEYFISLPVPQNMPISEILVTHSAAPIVDVMDKVRTDTLVSLAILMLASVALASLLTKLLTSPLRELARASVSLRNNAARQHPVKFPRSRIQEFDDLSLALQGSSDNMLDHVAKLKEMRDNLEARVDQRTKELARLSMVASQTDNGVIITDANGVIEWVNEGLTRMTGYSLTELVGKKPGKILQGEGTSRRTAKRISNALAKHQSFHEEILNYTKDKKEIWLQISCNPMKDDAGKVTGFIGIETDVTERRLDRLNLIRARIEAERSNNAKSQFLSTMSHEIRTPLNGIMGMAQLMTDTELGEDQETYLQTILSSSNTLLAIINDVLDMSKIEAGALEIEKTPFELSGLVSSTLSPFRTLASDKNLILKTGTLPALDRDIIGDPVRVRQILINLVSNAIKFTDFGTVSVHISVNENQSWQDKGYDAAIELKVQDTGAGISKDRQSDIFNAFTQEDNTITRKFGGTGLGLSIVKKLVDMMEGTIEVESEMGEGTCFTVTIPFTFDTVRHHEKTPDEEAPEKNYMSGIKVIVAEDNMINAVIAKTFLEKKDCIVSLASNGQAAVDLVKEEMPDLIFMDVHMPIMDGIGATNRIREFHCSEDLPIIGLTADAFKENREKFKEAGMNYVLTKPFKEEQLEKILCDYFPINSADDQLGKEVNPVQISSNIEDETPIGDDKEFQALQDQIGSDAMAPMLQLAPESFRDHLEQIRTAITNADTQNILEASHAIKGAAGSLYALRLTKLAGYIEKNSASLSLVENVFPEFETTVENSIQWLQAK